MTEPVRVFLCSTYDDLVTERKAVLESLRELKLAHESMEYFGARPSPAIDACLAEVAKSSMLVLVVGHRYGSLVPDQNLSFTEAEYQEGYRLKKPCLVYVRSDDVPVLPKYYESDPDKFRALESFKKVLNERHTVARFRAADDLAEAVRTNIRETLAAVESQSNPSADTREAFFVELNEIASSALASGYREAVLLSAFRRAVASLQRPQPTLLDRLVEAISPKPMRKQDKRVLERHLLVFFSYAQSDRDVVIPVAKELKRLGVRVWLDQQALVPGDSLLEGIQSGLGKADALIFFASARSLRSEWARRELDYFMAKRVLSAGGPLLIPVLLEDVELPGVLRDVLYIDMRQKDARHTAKHIVAALWGVPVDEIH